MTMMEQRNYSADSTLLMKEQICVKQLKYDQAKVDQSKKTIPVQHAVVDSHQWNLFYIIRQYRAKLPLDKTHIMTLSELMLRISEKYKEDIQSHPILMKINDALFDRTRIFFNLQLFIWIFLYMFPLIIQILFSGKEYHGNVKTCNIICLVVIIMFQL